MPADLVHGAGLAGAGADPQAMPTSSLGAGLVAGGSAQGVWWRAPEVRRMLAG
jgi:hypothetical protein